MYRVISCLTAEHDFRLVVLAILVCLATATTTFKLYAIAHHYSDQRRFGWAALSGVCAGAGIWTTHFIAMLAYKEGLPTFYEPLTTFASLLVAVLLAASGFALASYGRRNQLITGGTVVGLAIGLMHYLGMSALIVPGTLTWDATLIGVSVVLGMAFAIAALIVFEQQLSRGPAIAGAALLLTLAVCSLHFTAMGAVVINPDPTVSATGGGFSRLSMALAVAGVAFVVLLSGLAAALIQRTNQRCEAMLREHNTLLDTALGHLPVALSMFDANHRLVMCNDAYRCLYDLVDGTCTKRITFSELVHQQTRHEVTHDPRSESTARQLAAHEARLATGKSFSDTIELSDGRIVFKRVAPIAGGGWVDVQEDITALTNSSRRIEWLARHDPLTEIENRFAFRERLEREFASYDPRAGFALHWIDLDNFKDINDTLGHQVGDALLCCVANRLAGGLRVSDAVGRLGGDEFAIIQVGVRDPGEAKQFAERLLANIRGPHQLRGQRIASSASIGTAIAPLHGHDADELFASADKALYRAKSLGRDIAVVYDSTILTTEAPNPLVGELRVAIERNEFVLHYQPIIDLKLGRVTGFEALVRWKHPTRGMMPPSEFISIAESTGVIVPLENLVLEQALRDAASWPADVAIAVNLSAAQVEQSGFYASVTKAIEMAGIAPSRVQLEITETALLCDHHQASTALRKLDRLGVSLSLDDFGTSFANLSYLREFPFDRLKIDRSFVHEIPQNEDCWVIVSSVADLAHRLHLRAVAEVIETLTTLRAVQAAGYDEAQGFYFSLPIPAHAVRRTITQCEKRLSDVNGLAA